MKLWSRKSVSGFMKFIAFLIKILHNKKWKMQENNSSVHKALMKMFGRINIGKCAGSGVPNIFNVWADEGWEAEKQNFAQKNERSFTTPQIIFWDSTAN